MSEKYFRETRTQIGILKGRGLIIRNKRFAKRVIRKTNYYNLINGYKDPFLQDKTSTEKFIVGTTFEEIYALYEFDRKLRIITLEHILEIEKEIKSLVSYTFSKKHGHKDYLKLENFDTKGAEKYGQVCQLFSGLYKKIQLNIDKDLSITHYVDGKNYLPLWVLVNSISLGDISKFYSNMLQNERDEVAKRMKWGVRENQLSNIIFFLATIRNRCAHDERLYSYLSYTSLHKNKYSGYFHTRINNNYFSVMMAFKLILSKEQYMAYQSEFEQLFSELLQQLKTVSNKKIRDMMGLPSNWKKLKDLA